MKRRFAIMGLALAAFLGLGWHNHRQLASLRETRAKLAAQAAAKGITGDAGNPETLSLPAKLPRLDRVAEAKRIAAEFIAFADDMKGMPYMRDPDALDAVTRERIMAQMDRVTALDAGQLKILIAEVHAASGGTDEYRDLLSFALHRLVKDHPGDVLGILMNTPGVLEMVRGSESLRAGTLISLALSDLSKRDPAAALEWFRKIRERLGEFEQDSAKHILVTTAVANDPRLGLALADELGMAPDGFLPQMLTRSTPEKRTDSLALLREWQARAKDSSPQAREAFKSALKKLAFGTGDDPRQDRPSFADSAPWLDQAGLSPEELVVVAEGLQTSFRPEDASLWLEWLERRLPPKSVRVWSCSVFRLWLEADVQAAERWLDAAPAGPIKDGVVMEYVKTVVRVDPQKAIQRALTLPEGKKRRDALDEIYYDWPRKDENEASKAAAEAFAREHEIKH